MRQRLLPAVLAALAWTQTACAADHDVTGDFVGRGKIHVINSTSFDRASMADRIGCLNAHGMLTVKDCAVFTRTDDFPNGLVSKAGKCSFRNPNMPQNRDSYYGSDTHAWSCGGGTPDDGLYEAYYTVNGFNYPFVCNGNLNCWYDIMATPPKGDEWLPAWQFFWGSQQMDIPPGHSRVLWMWVPVPKEAPGGHNEE